MKTTTKTPDALNEVWHWKNAVYEDTKNMTCAERREYYGNSMKQAASDRGFALVQESNGAWRMVRK
jgi:hypothetical protein